MNVSYEAVKDDFGEFPALGENGTPSFHNNGSAKQGLKAQ
jgi:hypothetical protein